MRSDFRAFLVGLGLGVAGAVTPATAVAQSRDSTGGEAAARDSTPACCSVVRVDSTRTTITARETTTGYTFRFLLKDRRLQRRIKVGQPVWADFSARKVKLGAAGATPCCDILETQERQ